MENINQGAAVSVQAISVTGAAPFKNPGDVDFNVKYPEGYSGPKYMPEGVVTISKESAEQFKALGLGSIVGEEGEQASSGDAKGAQLKADEVIAKINAAETAEAVDELIIGDPRKTVIAAAESRKKQLADNK